MATATKTVTLRLPEELVEYLSAASGSINQAVIFEMANLRRIRAVSIGEVKGIFTPEEWRFMAHIFNGVVVDDLFRANVGVFIASCEDAERFDGSASRHGIDFGQFCNKVRGLHGANIEAIYARIEDYWRTHQEKDLMQWSVF